MREHGHWWLRELLCRQNLTTCQLTKATLTQTKAYFGDFIFQKTLYLSHLVRFLNSSVHVEVLVLHHDFLIEFLLLLLPLLHHLFHHIFSRNEDSLEIGGIRECLFSFDLGLEVNLADITRHEFVPAHSSLSVLLLLHVRNHQVIHCCRMGPLWMFVPILLLAV